ncbi:MAG: NAD(P)-dependent oxidoreductase [Candidatus Methylomirabilia bacterium]
MMGDDRIIGFIGLGQMGGPMAGRLLDAGYSLIIHDLRQEAAKPLLDRGAVWAASPAAVAREARVLITMLPSSVEVKAVMEGFEGLLSALQPESVCLEMSTGDPAVTRELAEAVAARGGVLLDAPVSGGVRGARAGTLSIMVGGPEAVLEAIRPILGQLGAKIFHVGPVGAGHAIKLVNNVCSAAALLVTAEGVAVAAKAGIDPSRAVEILQVSSGRSNASDYKFPEFILTGRFDAGFAIRLMAKDLDGYVRLARESQVPSLLGTPAAECYRMALARGMGEDDHTMVVRLIEEWAGIQLRKR